MFVSLYDPHTSSINLLMVRLVHIAISQNKHLANMDTIEEVLTFSAKRVDVCLIWNWPSLRTGWKMQNWQRSAKLRKIQGRCPGRCCQELSLECDLELQHKVDFMTNSDTFP